MEPAGIFLIALLVALVVASVVSTRKAHQNKKSGNNEDSASK